MSGSSFFPSGSATNDGSRVVPTTPTGRLDDVHLQSASLSGDYILSLILNDGVTVTADLTTLSSDTFATGLAFSSSNRQLTLNRNDGNNFSTTITSAGDGLQSLSLDGTTFILTATLADGSIETVDLSSLVSAEALGGRAFSPSAGNDYAVGDIVSYNSQLYLNITGNATTATPDTDTTNWSVYQSGETDLGGRIWSTTATYNFGDIVTRLGRQYQAIVGTPTVGLDPEVTTTEWKLLINNDALPTTRPTGADLTIFQTTAPSREVVADIRDTVDTLLSWSNIPRLTENLVADQEYTVWVNNRSTSNTNSITRTAIDIQGQDATTLVNPGVATAGRVTAFYVTFNATTVGDIQNNATNVEPTITFTTPNEVVRVATGEGSSGSALTGTEIIAAINEASTTGRINADHVTQPTLDPSESENIARITLDNGDIAVPNSIVNLIGRGGITVDFDSANARDITFSGTTAPHAQLRTGLTVSPDTVNRADALPASNTAINGVPTASISNAGSGDVINSITINSAHASYENNNLNIRADRQTFAYNIASTAPAQTVVFTCVFTVNYTVDGVTMDHQVTHTANLLVRQAPITFRYGTFTQTQFNQRNTLTATQIATSLPDTADRVTYPYSQDYTGTAIPTNTYAALFVPDSAGTITSVRSEGFVLNFERRSDSLNVGGVNFSLYTVTAPLSEGTHTIEWRT